MVWDSEPFGYAEIPDSWIFFFLNGIHWQFAVVMKSGNLNFLEPSGPLQACNGTALPLPLTIHNFSQHNCKLPEDGVLTLKHVRVI